MLKRSGGQRQCVWNLLLQSDSPISVSSLSASCGGQPSSIRTYLGGLAKNGYARKQVGGWILLRKTGPEAPAYSIQSGGFRDWNVDKPMPASRLASILDRHGGPISAFCRDLGFHIGAATKIAQMLRGQRPVSGPVEDAALKWLDSKKVNNATES